MFKKYLKYIEKNKIMYIIISVIILVISVYYIESLIGPGGTLPKNYVWGVVGNFLKIFLSLFIIYNIIILIISLTSRKK